RFLWHGASTPPLRSFSYPVAELLPSPSRRQADNHQMPACTTIDHPPSHVMRRGVFSVNLAATGGFQVRRSLICATIVCTLCEHAQPKSAKNSSHTTSAPAHEDLPRRRIVRWLSAYFLVPNWRLRRPSSIKPPSCFVPIPATPLRSFARSTMARLTPIMTRSSSPMARSFC